MHFDPPLLRGALVRRYKRFLADVELPSGEIVTVHCPNPGAMTGCMEEGSSVWLSRSTNPRRKLPLTWELVQVGSTWVGINTARTNAIVREALDAGLVEELVGYPVVRSEVPYGRGSRIDFLLEGPAGRCFVEVKNATLAESGVAMFPDSVTARGLKHLRELTGVVERGDRGILLFLVNREDCTRFEPAAHVDPAYAAGLAEAETAGVEVLVYTALVSPSKIEVCSRIRFRPL